MTSPKSTLAFRCAGCPCVPIAAAVSPWHSTQLFVPPPYTVPQVYTVCSGGPACPLLSQALGPHVPNEASTVISRLPVYSASAVTTVPPKLTDPFRCVEALPAGLWQSPHTLPPPVVVERCAA